MLPAYIIEELRRREEARHEETSRPQPMLEIEIPLRRRDSTPPGPPDRGVTIIQVG